MGKLPAVPGPHLQAKCPWLGKNRHKIENQMCRIVYPRWAALHHSPQKHSFATGTIFIQAGCWCIPGSSMWLVLLKWPWASAFYSIPRLLLSWDQGCSSLGLTGPVTPPPQVPSVPPSACWGLLGGYNLLLSSVFIFSILSCVLLTPGAAPAPSPWLLPVNAVTLGALA